MMMKRVDSKCGEVAFAAFNESQTNSYTRVRVDEKKMKQYLIEII